MSSRPVLCPVCRQGTLVDSRPGKTAAVLRLAAGVWAQQVKPGTILMRCPECGKPVEWTGKRLIIVDA